MGRLDRWPTRPGMGWTVIHEKLAMAFGLGGSANGVSPIELGETSEVGIGRGQFTSMFNRQSR